MIDSGTISKIQKARKYAEERDERIRFTAFTIELDGENNHHTTNFDRGNWACDCEFFHTHSHCSHTMAMERVLGAMLPVPAPSAPASSDVITSGDSIRAGTLAAPA